MRILSFLYKRVGDPLRGAAEYLQLAYKDVKRRIIVCKDSSFRACERTGFSTVRGSQRPWMWPFSLLSPSQFSFMESMTSRQKFVMNFGQTRI
jgi:hypothetical protein